MPERAIIKMSGNMVVLTYLDAETDEKRVREFIVPSAGGSVIEWVPGCLSSIDGRWTQVCNGLRWTGETLTAGNSKHLLALIRSEYAAMRRAEKRAAKRL